MKAGLLLALLQVPGCWCEPVPREVLNPFPDGLPGGAAAYCAAWADSACQAAQRCDPPLHRAFSDEGGCAARMAERCERDHAAERAAEQAGRAVYDARYARGCVEGEAARGCEDAAPAACAAVFTGTVAQDGPCADDAECAGGLFCSGGPLTCGLCTPRSALGGPCWGASSCLAGTACTGGRCERPLSAGASCAAAPDACPAGTACFPFLPGVGPLPVSTCVAPLAEGAPCDRANPLAAPCAEGLACASSGAGGTRCLGPVGEGQPCDPQGASAPSCRGAGKRLFCEPASRRCRPVTVVVRGAACDDGDACSAADRCVGGTCRRRPSAGEACDAAAGDPCFESRCVEGTCVQAARAGEPCDAGCPGLSCQGGACGKAACDGGEAWDAAPPAADAG